LPSVGGGILSQLVMANEATATVNSALSVVDFNDILIKNDFCFIH
jgi:hypothetical protein